MCVCRPFSSGNLRPPARPARHCKCGGPGAEETTNARDGECSCLPEASLPDTTPLSADGSSRGSNGSGGAGSGSGGDSVGSSEAQGQRSRSPAGFSSGGIVAAAGLAGGREDYDVGGVDAPKSLEALREQLRLKDAQG